MKTSTFAWALAAALCLSGSALAEGQQRHGRARPATWVSGEVLVGFRAGVGPTGRHSLYRKHGAEYLEDVGAATRIVRLRVPAGAEDAMVSRLQRMPEVKFVEKNFEFTPALVPNDPEYVNQWYLPHIHADQSWDLSQGGVGTVIAILDSGIDAAHVDFAGKLVAGYNTFSNTTDTSDAFGHGTEVAGVAGALTNNALGIAGLAGLSPLMPVRVTNAAGAATAASIASGIIWATDHGARVINLSFDGIAGNATITTAAEYAYNHGTLVVAAAGNCGCADPTPETPVVLSVGSTDELDALASFSATGPFVDVTAPGTNILTTAKFSLYFSDSGTSLSSPLVAGVAAQMFAAKPTLTPALVTGLLESSAVDLGTAGYDSSFGYGRVDALAAVNAAINYSPPVDATPPSVALVAPGSGASVSGTVVVDVAANDNIGVAKVDLLVDAAYFASDAAFPYSFAWDTTALPNGPHTLQVQAFDAAGNSAITTAVGVSVNNVPPDTTLPTVSISAPLPGVSVSGTVSVQATAADNVGVASVVFSLDGTVVATVTSAPYAWSWNTTQSAEGAHTLLVAAFDAAGNTRSASVGVTVANVVPHPPMAQDDAFPVVFRPASPYAPQVLSVLANDSDADGDMVAASVHITQAPDQRGVASVNPDGSISYTPRQGFRGTETLRYTVNDARGASSNVATVTLSVNGMSPRHGSDRGDRNVRRRGSRP